MLLFDKAYFFFFLFFLGKFLKLVIFAHFFANFFLLAKAHLAWALDLKGILRRPIYVYIPVI